jgi:hypothetical protein
LTTVSAVRSFASLMRVPMTPGSTRAEARSSGGSPVMAGSSPAYRQRYRL